MARPENVVPLRPKRRAKRGMDWKAPRTMAVLVHALTIATFTLYFFAEGPVEYLAAAVGIAAIAIAAGRRREGMPWACTHHEFALRTLLFGGVAWVLARLVTLIPAAAPYATYAILGICAWVGLRCLWAFARAILRLPMPRPTSPLL